MVPSSPTHVLTAASRQTALRLGEQYALHTYTCSANNLSPVDVTGPDGDIVRTPAWLIAGINARIAYRWGGFNTLAQYDDGLKFGKYAGDINTAGVSSYAVGVDCSGFVSRCWQLSSQYSTSMMPDITTQYATWNDLKPGDAIHKVGHVRLFVEKMPNGSLRVVESSARGWDVSYWSYAPSALTGVYTPRCYIGMDTSYSVNRPELVSASLVTDSTVQLVWKSDTTNVSGYRLYSSLNGTTWNSIKDETTLHDTSVIVPLKNSAASFRVSSVLRGAVPVEGLWSNALSAGNFSSAHKLLVVDGFERSSESGSWQGPGNTFIPRYGNVLAVNSLSFESIKNSQLSNPHFTLSRYSTVVWMLGDESTINETFSSAEQVLVKNYLEAGGSFFVSGSEIGWDLSAKGTADDQNFYTSYLKATYKADNASSSGVKGINGDIFSGSSFAIGQTYTEDYPDEIDTANGSTLCLQYANAKGAGVRYTGKFGTSSLSGKIIYLSFPLETTADEASFRFILEHVLSYFSEPLFVTQDKANVPDRFSLSQNFPNPFNPATTISYQLLANRFTTLKVYDAIGREVATLVNEIKAPGNYSVTFNAQNLSSGMYFYELRAGEWRVTKKMSLLK
ncbi:MAG: T9SS type A sorting domain-containing protein [Bacteroidota bacterium]|nr:T9SS type A sorting domain-containing protein [Bacteroidota bacterium]